MQTKDGALVGRLRIVFGGDANEEPTTTIDVAPENIAAVMNAAHGRKGVEIETLEQRVKVLESDMDYIRQLTQRADISEGGKVAFIATKTAAALKEQP